VRLTWNRIWRIVHAGGALAALLIAIPVVLLLMECNRVDLYHAIVHGDVAGVRRAIEQGQDIDQRLSSGKRTRVTPLMLASKEGDLSIVRMLILAGADVNATNSLQETPLFYAARSRNSKVVAFLLESGADSAWRASNGRHVLIEACKLRDNLAVIRTLLRARVPVTITDDSGATPLEAAVALDFTKGVEVLLRNGASVDSRHAGRTPLHSAARWASVQTVTKLLEYGAVVNATDGYGRTPLHYAVQRGETQMVQRLVEHGASPVIADDQGLTPIDYASANDLPQILEILEEG